MDDFARPVFSVWHEGELEVQQRAGVREEAEELRGMYKRSLPPALAGFLSQQPFAVLSSADSAGRVWANLLAGAPGMLESRTPGTLSLVPRHIETRVPLDDIANQPQVGLLVVDFARRIRLRINGHAYLDSEGSVTIAIDQTYGNCSQYIQRRVIDSPAQPATSIVTTSSQLSDDQQQFVRAVDTFFVASRHPQHGADASHRGGKPGFVTAASPSRISFPDYSGNKMFNTLGNVTVNPAIGLLFVDFASGGTLQVSGRASIDWNPERASKLELAQRTVDVEIEAVRETRHATTLRFRFIGYSPTLG